MPDEKLDSRAFPRRNRSLQAIGILLLALVVAGGLAGSALMAQDPFSAATLAVHIALALSMVGVSMLALRLARGLQGWRPTAAAAVGLLSAVGATLAGAVFLLGGEALAALHWMEGFTGAIIVASVLLLAWGAARPRVKRHRAGS